MPSILNVIFQFFGNVEPVVFFLIITFIGMFIFWRGGVETRKDRSSVFDMFFISILFSLLIGRLMFIISNWASYSNLGWYWLPYEKYDTGVYLFRVLPWKFLNIFDGGLDILSMFVGFLFGATLWGVGAKKWSWNDIFPTIYLTGETMLSLSFILMGLGSANASWIYEGLILLVFPLVAIIMINYTNKIERPALEKKLYIWGNSLLIIISIAVVAYIYMTGGLTIYEKISLYPLIAWTVIGLIIFLKNSKKMKVTIEKVSSVREFEINQPIKL